ncbi:YopX family protein [Bariatricus sp. SGI.161]|uniref:YopX family protein n=1 Tax=Bariatricus sp. SGI.161 TaxID=3420550 RepID=UPI003CFF0D4C
MNDRYLYRAKHVHAFDANKKHDGWVYGYLSCENYIYSPELEEEKLIDPNTICQCTGLKDKNGKLIWENDIVRYTDGITGKQKTDRIIWNQHYAGFARMHKSKMGLQYLYINGSMAIDFEVIGNAIDNPKLLEV